MSWVCEAPLLFEMIYITRQDKGSVRKGWFQPLFIYLGNPLLTIASQKLDEPEAWMKRTNSTFNATAISSHQNISTAVVSLHPYRPPTITPFTTLGPPTS